jgi:tetratricopeptide (TPR) repeat protein
MLAIGELRVRAARCLEAVYEERDEVRDLVRVLEVRLESETESAPDDRRDLIRRVAVLRNERLHDDEGAFAAFSRLVPLEPSDAEARARLLEIGKRLSADERVAKVLLAAADATKADALAGEILTTVAVLYEERLSDLKRAEQIYRRVLDLDPNEPSLVLPAARSLERIYRSQNEPQKLAEMLRVQVRMEGDGGVRRDLLGRLGELCQNVLHDDNGAIVAWRARLDESPDDEPALAALDSLYEATGKHSELVDVLRRRRDLSDDAALRRTLLNRSADILWRRIGALTEAIEEYRSLVDEFGPTVSSLSSLEELFRLTERWEDLSDTYERHLEIAESDSARLDIFSRLGDLKRERQNDIPQALEVYRRALAVDAKHAPTRAALEKLLESPDPAIRREVAQILRPLYEADGDGNRLLNVLEIEIETAEDALDKLAGIDSALRVADTQLGDSNKAFAYAERGVRAAIGHTDLSDWFVQAERLSRVTSRQADYVKLLCEAVSSIFDGEVQLSVTLKIADLARTELKDNTLARDYYKRALDLRADEPRALAALEALYEESKDATNLLDILERRSEGAANDEERKRLLYRRAALLSDDLDDKTRAIETYESVLDMALEEQAISALEKLYTTAERWSDLIALYERQIQANRGNASELRVRIAGVAARRTGDPERAFDELEHALKADRQHEGAIAELERMLKEASDAGHRARAAELLEPVYLSRADYDRVMAAMQARLEVVNDPDDRRELLTRLAKLYEEQKEDYAAALETTARLLHEDIDDSHTADELERLARVAGAERRLGEIYAEELGQTTTEGPAVVRLARRAGEIFDLLGEPSRALSFYRRALAFEPENRSLFSATDAILVRQGLFEDRIKLHRDALDHYFEPSERLALLHTIAAVERRELKRPDDAIATYRSALEIDNREPSTLDALTELFRERERWDDLSELYLSRAEQSDRPEQGIRYRLDLARLSRKLGRGERAVDQLEEIVRLEPANADAIAELDALRADEKLKERVVEILRPLYEAADDWRRLVKLNEDRFALGDDIEKVSVLRETAKLWEQRGADKKRARRALETAIRIDPDDADVRADYERLIDETEAHSELARAYEAILEERPELNSKADFYRVLARTHDQKLDDPRRALWAYDRLREADPNDVTSLDALERLAILLSDWPTLVRVLEAKAEVFLDDEERAGFLRRIGEAKRDMLDDRDGAIQAYERAFELDATSAFTADCLIELYEAKGEPGRLVDLYQRRVELTSDEDADLKYTLLVAAASTFEEKLKDRSSAIDMLTRALETKPGDKDALSGLDRLYRAESLWSELLENLRTRVTFADTPEARVALRKEMGEVLGEKLHSPEDALGAYRDALDEIPSDEEAVRAVHALGKDHEELRRQVAEILEPVLRKTERYEPLIEVLELRFSVESDPSDRSRTLSAIAEVYEGKLGKQKEAEGALLRALAERPEAEDLHSEIARLARASNDFRRYADTLAERAQGTFEAELARDLFVRLGKIAETELADPERAVTAYERAIEQAGDAPELLKALDRLYAVLKNQDKVADVLERLVVLVGSDEEQAELYQRLAEIQSSHFKDDARALSSLRSALERVPAHPGAVQSLERLTDQRDLFDEVSEILEEVYRGRGDAQKLASLWQKRVEFAADVEQRVSMRRGLARVLEEDVKDPAAAQRAIEQGLIESPGDAELLEELERLAGITGDFTSAADSLRQAIENQRERILPDLACALARRLSSWHRDRRNDPSAAESALLYGLEFDPDNEELLIELEALQQKPGRERDLVATLRRRATLESSPETRADLYQQAKALADGLNDEKLAEGLLRELLALDDTNLWALAELSRQRENARDFREAFQLLLRRAELGLDGEENRKLRRRAAEIARSELSDPEKATELFEALFEEEPTDANAAAALRSLYTEGERHRELGRLIERLVDVAEDASTRSELRLELAKLSETRFDSIDTAIDLVRAVLDDEPGRPDAVVALSELYERSKRDEDLADLLSSQIDAARARGDVDAELRFQVRLGDVYESRLGDRARAIDTYRSVLDRDASHRGALESLARLYASESRLADAAEVLDKLLSMSTGKEAVELAIRLSETHEKLGDPDSATLALERGLKEDPQHPELRTRVRKAYEAAEAWEKLGSLLAQDAEFAKTDEERVGLLRRAAKLHAERRQDHEKAAELLSQATQIKPDDRELLLELCDEYNASGRGKAAAEVLEKIVLSYGNKRSKELAEIHRRLAGAYLADGNGARALEELDKAFRIEPGNVNVLSLLGETALDLGDLKKAQQMYRALLLQKLDEGGPVQKGMVFVRLGDIHDKLGERPKAQQMYERAIQTDPGLAEAKTKLAQLKGGSLPP